MIKPSGEWMDGWKEGRKEGRKDGWVGGWMDGRMEGWSEGVGGRDTHEMFAIENEHEQNELKTFVLQNRQPGPCACHEETSTRHLGYVAARERLV